MLNPQLLAIYQDIISESVQMVSARVDKEDLLNKLDYLTIFAKSNDDFKQISHELEKNGVVAIPKETGSYYKLHKPLQGPFGLIFHCRVRTFDNTRPEKGYVDFGVKDYNQFKKKYQNMPDFSVIFSGKEMIELNDPKFSVRAYFISGSF